MNKFVFFNDTNKDISIHFATKEYGIVCDMSDIKPLEEREFILPKGSYAHIKQWRNGMIFVSAKLRDNQLRI